MEIEGENLRSCYYGLIRAQLNQLIVSSKRTKSITLVSSVLFFNNIILILSTCRYP